MIKFSFQSSEVQSSAAEGPKKWLFGTEEASDVKLEFQHVLAEMLRLSTHTYIHTYIDILHYITLHNITQHN